MKSPTTYALMDVFAGCGGMSRGFSDSSRFRPVFAVEADPGAAATYRANFRDAHVIAKRIEMVARFPHVDLVIGGPPCQGFSMLNRERERVESRMLWREYLRALKAANPLFFVMENVPQMFESPEYERFVRSARALGYRVESRTFNVADFGVPQRRSRGIAIGTRLGDVPWPVVTHRDPTEPDDGRHPWRTFREAVTGLSLVPDGRNRHTPRRPWPETVRRYEAVPPDGGNRFQMQAALEAQGLGHLVPPCWRRHRSGSHDVFGRLWWDRPATTIRTEFFKPEKGRYLHPSEHRAITIREAARLMSIEDDFVLPEDQSMTAIGRQIGNAVPPLLARRLAEPIVAALDASVNDLDAVARRSLRSVA